MAVCLGHTTALQTWAALTASGVNYGYSHVDLRDLPPVGIREVRRDASVSAFISSVIGSQGAPVELVVSGDGGRRTSRYIKSYGWTGSIPARSIVHVDDWPGDVYLSSPGFCLLQLAARTELPLLTKYVMDLCGRYAVGGYRPPATTSKDWLTDYLLDAESRHGLSKLRKAVGLAFENSWSIAETVSSLMLFLPPELGGCFQEEIAMNEGIHVPLAHQAYLGQETMYPDMRSKSHPVIVQYNGMEDHQNLKAQNRDRRWDNTATTMGYVVRTLDALTVGDVFEFERFAQELAPHLGVAFAPRTGKQAVLRDHLRELLLPEMGLRP